MGEAEARHAGLLAWSLDVRAAVQRLGPAQSRIVQMIYFERRTQAQVATELELSRPTVARAVASALQVLGAGLLVD